MMTNDGEGDGAGLAYADRPPYTHTHTHTHPAMQDRSSLKLDIVVAECRERNCIWRADQVGFTIPLPPCVSLQHNGVGALWFTTNVPQ